MARLWILRENETGEERFFVETSNPADHPVEIRLDGQEKEFRRQQFLSAVSRARSGKQSSRKTDGQIKFFWRRETSARFFSRFLATRGERYSSLLQLPPPSLPPSRVSHTTPPTYLKAIVYCYSEARPPIGTVSWVHFARPRSSQSLARNFGISI